MKISSNTMKSSQRYKQNLSSILTHVLAVKDFKCSVVCFSCKKNLDLLPDADVKTLVTCSCPAKCMFMIESASMRNYYSILLSDKQWFSANTSVSNLCKCCLTSNTYLSPMQLLFFEYLRPIKNHLSSANPLSKKIVLEPTTVPMQRK